MSFLEIEHEWLHVDIIKGETHSDEFKKMNPNTRILVLVLNDGRTLTESNAIPNFLADGSELIPADISLYAYTHVAHEGSFDLGSHASIRKWVERIEQHSN